LYIVATPLGLHIKLRGAHCGANAIFEEVQGTIRGDFDKRGTHVKGPLGL
jgi:hypothetical protein